jgi:hypothetical protein
VLLDVCKIHLIGTLVQFIGDCFHAHCLKALLCLLGNSDRYAVVGALQVTGQKMAGNFIFSMLRV